jgi:ABC-type oligopeptide transport system ATPase subunit
MQKMVVENFRQIPFAEIEIRQLLFLIGEQATGKSTLAKLIYFFKSLKGDLGDLILDQNTNPDNLKQLFYQKIQDKFKTYFGYIEELDSNFSITFYYRYDTSNVGTSRYLKLTKSSTLNISFSDGYFRDIVDSTKFLIQRIRQTSQAQLTSGADYLGLQREINRLLGEFDNQVNALFDENRQSMFFPAGRNITVSFPEQFQAQFLSALPVDRGLPKSVDLELMKSFILHSKFLIDFFKQYKLDQPSEVSNFISDHIRYILKGVYDNSDGTEKIIVGADSNQEVPLNLASSGQQEVVRIVQDLLYIWISHNEFASNRPAYRVMEEPEAHLHPSAQKRLLELIALVANLTDSQFLITTHSPYLISVLNNLLMYSAVQERDPAANEQLGQHFGTVQLPKDGNAWINLLRDQVQAYSLGRGDGPFCASLLDPETGLIGDNYLDGVTEELNNDFNFLYQLHFTH